MLAKVMLATIKAAEAKLFMDLMATVASVVD